MRIIARRTIKAFIAASVGRKDHAALKTSLEAWYHEVKLARWAGPQDVRRRYATVSVVSHDRLVFNIKGNDYRLIVAIDYEKQIVWIKWIGTHRDYDRIDARTVSYHG